MDKSSYKILTFKASEIPPQFNGMVHKTFRISHRKGNPFFRLIIASKYYKYYTKYINSLFIRPSAYVRIAVLDDNDTVLGWVFREPDVVHYVYVFDTNLQIGVATALLSEPFSRFSHMTTVGLHIKMKKYPDAKFDPFFEYPDVSENEKLN